MARGYKGKNSHLEKNRTVNKSKQRKGRKTSKHRREQKRLRRKL